MQENVIWEYIVDGESSLELELSSLSTFMKDVDSFIEAVRDQEVRCVLQVRP